LVYFPSREVPFPYQKPTARRDGPLERIFPGKALNPAVDYKLCVASVSLAGLVPFFLCQVVCFFP